MTPRQCIPTSSLLTKHTKKGYTQLTGRKIQFQVATIFRFRPQLNPLRFGQTQDLIVTPNHLLPSARSLLSSSTVHSHDRPSFHAIFLSIHRAKCTPGSELPPPLKPSANRADVTTGSSLCSVIPSQALKSRNKALYYSYNKANRDPSPPTSSSPPSQYKIPLQITR